MEIIIVLGNRNPAITEKRVAAAVAHFLSTPQTIKYENSREPEPCKYLLLSGGSSDGVSKPEGAVMMEQATLRHGIDKRFIILEKESKNTVENLRNSLDIIKKMFHTSSDYFPLIKITVCTSSFHIKRSLVLAKLIFSKSDILIVHTNESISAAEERREAGLLFRTMNDMLNL